MACSLRFLICMCFIASLKSQEIYITPNSTHETTSCMTSKILLTPCYTLNQIIENEVLMLMNGNETRIKMKFLQGTHVMPENEVLNIANLDEVELEPWNEVLDVMIDCQPGSELQFNNTGTLRIYSLHFLSCSLSCYYPKKSFHIIASVFEGSKRYAIYMSSITQVTVNISNSMFLQNHGAVTLQDYHYSGHRFLSRQLTCVHIENSTFEDNIAATLDVIGTALTVRYTSFTNNSANEGGGIRAQDSSLTLNYTTFTNNQACQNGGAILLNDSYMYVFECYFMNNKANAGGAISNTANGETVKIYRATFICNNASDKGGALHFIRTLEVISKDCKFERNSAKSGGALSIERAHGHLVNTLFVSNRARGNGGAVYFVNDATPVCSCRICCGLSLQSSNFSNNTANIGGGIFACHSILIYKTTTLFAKNRAKKNGGALALHSSTIILDANTTLTFNQNVAESKGGAMFINDNCEQMSDNNQCFITINNNSNLAFENNMAKQGKDIYGGLLDRCKIEGRPGIEFFSYANNSEAITSDPIRVCLCDSDHKPNCTIREKSFKVTPGDYIEVDIVMVDQNINPRPCTIVAEYYNDTDNTLGQGERNQETLDDCTKLKYHVISEKPSENIHYKRKNQLILRPKYHCTSSSFSRIVVHMRVSSCPRGFEEKKGKCDCEDRIANFTTNCNARNDFVEKNSSLWLSYDGKYLKVNKFCPLNYCNLTSKNISLKFPDKQCANNRSGVLCGACQDNHSIALGSSKCLYNCTSNYAIFWLILVVLLVAGVALVAFLLICNINISHGTINGLIFYANIVSISGLTSFQNCPTHPILTVFIAWLNLDFGIEMCFHSRMDTYQKTWLQFAFPLYIWLLVGGIILASHFSARAMKVFGRNNIAMLATLFLLSYTKLLKTVVTALTFTKILQGKADNTSDQLVPYYVWLYDGNIIYLNKKHTPLFFVSLMVLMFLFFPYTLLLTFGQFIHLIPRRRNCILKFIHSSALHSILDAYHAPYTKRHRYWTGLLLLSRCALIFALLSSYNESNLVALAHVTILVLIAILTLKATCALKVYKNTFIAILEISFLVNLLILSYFLKSSDESGDSNACKYISTSISISLVTFIGILCYHAYLQIRKTAVARALKKITLAKRPTKDFKNSEHSGDILPTSTSVELREPLLATSITDF